MTVGWQDAKQRSTTAIICSCITAVFACTWMTLPLNVPGPQDGIATKFWHKTLLFPESVFAKAVCELQTAVEGLCELRHEGDSGDYGWVVRVGRCSRGLHRLFSKLADNNTSARCHARSEQANSRYASPRNDYVRP